MTNAEWLASTDPAAMLEYLLHGYSGTSFRKGRYPGADDRRLRLFAVACCHAVWDLLPDDSSRRAVEIASRYADGEATAGEMEAARMVTIPIGSTLLSVCPSNYCCNSWSAETAAREAARCCEVLAHENRPFDQNQSATQAALLRDICNPFAPVTFSRPCPECRGSGRVHVPEAAGVYVMRPRTERCWRCKGGKTFRHPPPWLTSQVVAIAETIYAERNFEAVGVLADALEDAACDNLAILNHLRGVQQVKCNWCRGQGRVQWPDEGYEIPAYVRCEPCHGAGFVTPAEVIHCRGCFVIDAILGRE